MNIISKEQHGWERIALILEEQNISAAALARMIGLPDPRTLYRIKNAIPESRTASQALSTASCPNTTSSGS